MSRFYGSLCIGLHVRVLLCENCSRLPHMRYTVPHQDSSQSVRCVVLSCQLSEQNRFLVVSFLITKTKTAKYSLTVTRIKTVENDNEPET